MTNGDKIRSMNNDDLGKFLDDNFEPENVVAKWFAKKYCDKCKKYRGVTECGTEIEFYDCDDVKVGCPYGDDVIKKWLESEAE